MAKRRRSRKRGVGPTLLILVVTSALVGAALWALWRVTLRNEPSPVVVTPAARATPLGGEEIRASEREHLNAILRQSEKQGNVGDPAK